MQIIKYKDPLGRQLDLIRVPRRTIHFDMPSEYHGPKVEDVKQAVKFTREQIIEDNGDKHFTDWHCDDSFWAEYEPQKIGEFMPSQKIIEQKEVTPQTNGEDIHVKYVFDQQVPDSKKSVVAEEPLIEDDNEIESQMNDDSDDSSNNYSNYQSSISSQSNSSSSKSPFSSSSNDSKHLSTNRSNSLITSKSIDSSGSIEYSLANQIGSNSSLNEKLNNSIADDAINESTTNNLEKRGINKYTKPFVAPQEVQLIPLSSQLAYLRYDKVAGKILSSLKIIGYFYFSEGEWKEKSLYSGEY